MALSLDLHLYHFAGNEAVLQMFVAMNIAQLITNNLGLSYHGIDICMRMAIDPSIDATISNEVAQLCCECAIQRRILM